MFNKFGKIITAIALVSSLAGCIVYQPAQYPKYQPGTRPGDPTAEYCPYHRQYNCPYNHSRADINSIDSLNHSMKYLIQLLEHDRATALHTK